MLGFSALSEYAVSEIKYELIVPPEGSFDDIPVMSNPFNQVRVGLNLNNVNPLLRN